MEQQDFQHIVSSLRPRLLKLCAQFFDSQELAYEAEDAVQETLLRLWQQRDKIGWSPESGSIGDDNSQECLH